MNLRNRTIVFTQDDADIDSAKRVDLLDHAARPERLGHHLRRTMIASSNNDPGGIRAVSASEKNDVETLLPEETGHRPGQSLAWGSIHHLNDDPVVSGRYGIRVPGDLVPAKAGSEHDTGDDEKRAARDQADARDSREHSLFQKR